MMLYFVPLLALLWFAIGTFSAWVMHSHGDPYWRGPVRIVMAFPVLCLLGLGFVGFWLCGYDAALELDD